MILSAGSPPVTYRRRNWYEKSPTGPWLPEKAYLRLKRVMDLVLSLAAMPVILPLLGLICLAIRVDSPGPVLFFQKRTGRGGHRFKMFKLRTMVANAEEMKAELQHLNELSYPDFKISNDPRITRVGRFLRKTSLDELPQFFNVVKGEMSLVGPRPTSFKPETYRLWHTARLDLKPGITGLWQVAGRNELDFDERLRLDIAYHRNRCLTLDIRLLVRTVTCMFTGRGAN